MCGTARTLKHASARNPPAAARTQTSHRLRPTQGHRCRSRGNGARSWGARAAEARHARAELQKPGLERHAR
eukprot:10500449-Alexandrium_andersonii.AAC.1